MKFLLQGAQGVGAEAEMVRENDHFSYAEGLRREGTWNSPISAQSFPKIEEGNIVNSTAGSRWGPPHPLPWAFEQALLSSLEASLAWEPDLNPGLQAHSLAIAWVKESGEPWQTAMSNNTPNQPLPPPLLSAPFPAGSGVTGHSTCWAVNLLI